MLVVDDVLRLPVRGFWFILQEINNAVQQELRGETETIREKLREYYVLLDAGKITEEEFDKRENELLDRLTKIESLRADDEEDGDSEN